MLGLETEYLVAFVPLRSPPSRWLLLNSVEEAILKLGPACEAENGGYFLANGGAVSFESRRERRDNPVLELATPECTDPWQILRYVRAEEVLLGRVAASAERTLRRHGHPGRVVFGRSNTDWLGRTLGSQENYWIAWRDPWGRALAGAAAAGSLALVLACVDAFFFLAAHAAFKLSAFVRRSLRGGRNGVYLGLLRAGGRAARLPLSRAGVWWQGLQRFIRQVLVAGVEPVLGRLVLGNLTRDLAPFLATRQIFSGGGALQFDGTEGPLRLAARAARITRLWGVSLGQRGKAAFDLKPFVREPLSLLRRRKRLCVAGADSLMCETARFLSMGTTALVLTMLEEGARFPEARLSDPVRSWRRVSACGPHAALRNRDTRARTALEIQRLYLGRAMMHFAGAGEDSLAGQVLRLWKDMLERIENAPASLWGRVDWATKKMLLDGLVFSHGDWKRYGAYGVLFDKVRRRLPEDAPLTGIDRETVRLCLGPRGVRAFAPLLEDGEEFARQRALYLAAAKLNFGLHEISRRGGYHQQLRAAGEIPALIDEEDAARAVTQPPASTRAAIRARAIALARDRSDVRASWDAISVDSLKMRVTMRDPLLTL